MFCHMKVQNISKYSTFQETRKNQERALSKASAILQDLFMMIFNSTYVDLLAKANIQSLHIRRLNLSSWCLVMVEWLFLAVPWGCLRFVIVLFPDHTHLLFLKPWQLKLFKILNNMSPPVLSDLINLRENSTCNLRSKICS